MNSRNRILALLAAGLVYGAAYNTYAATSDEVTPLFFGHWIVANNASARNITLNPDGSFSSSPELIQLQAPVVGVYDISGLPDGEIIEIEATQLTPLIGSGGGEVWSTQPSFWVEPDTTTVTGGEVRVNVGGVVSTSGNGDMYTNDNYEGDVTLTFTIQP
jgi:hypothetical protein